MQHLNVDASPIFWDHLQQRGILTGNPFPQQIKRKSKFQF